jgi:hypothetical protein
MSMTSALLQIRVGAWIQRPMHISSRMQATKDIPAVRDMLTKAQAVLRYDLLKLCLEGPREQLDETRCAPAGAGVGMAGWFQEQESRVKRADGCHVGSSEPVRRNTRMASTAGGGVVAAEFRQL